MSKKYDWINKDGLKATCNICGGTSIWPFPAAKQKDYWNWWKGFKQQHKKCRHKTSLLPSSSG